MKYKCECGKYIYKYMDITIPYYRKPRKLKKWFKKWINLKNIVRNVVMN